MQNVAVTCARSNENYAKAQFCSEIAKVKNALASGVRLLAWLGKHAEFTSKQPLFTIQHNVSNCPFRTAPLIYFFDCYLVSFVNRSFHVCYLWQFWKDSCYQFFLPVVVGIDLVVWLSEYKKLLSFWCIRGVYCQPCSCCCFV